MMKLSGFDKLDQSYLHMLREIERLYVTFPKAVRLRIEKWITKLNNVGRVDEWRKNRNAYAKLLLNMIILKTLEEPFNAAPPDAPLGTLPAHIIGKYRRDFTGLHESSFWRETYANFEKSSNNSQLLSINNESVSQPNKSSFMDETHQSNTIGDTFYVIEIRKLTEIISQQRHQIDSLEKQLILERNNYEREIASLTQSLRNSAGNIRDIKLEVDPVYFPAEISLHSRQHPSRQKTQSNINEYSVSSKFQENNRPSTSSHDSSIKDVDAEKFMSAIKKFQTELKSLQEYDDV